jgi:hypothetical protein
MRIPLMVVVALFMMGLALRSEAVAQTPTEERLLGAVALFEQGDFPTARQRLQAVGDVGLSNRDRAIRDLYLGMISLALRDEPAARDFMLRALGADPEVRLDPSLHAPSRLQFFQNVRAEWLELAQSPTSLRFRGPPTTLSEGQSVRLVVEGLNRDGQPVSVQSVRWDLDDAESGLLSVDGIFSARRAGDVTVIATAGNLTTSHRFRVTPVVESVRVPGGARTLQEGVSLALDAIVTSRGGIQMEEVGLAWLSSDSTIAQVDQGGVVRGIREGSVTVSARAGDAMGSVQVEVRPGNLRIEPSQTSVELDIGGRAQLTARVVSGRGAVVSTVPTFSSTRPEVVSVDAQGRLTGMAEGVAAVEVSASGVATVRIPVEVRRVQLGQVRMVSGPRRVVVGDSLQLRGEAIGLNGQVLEDWPISFQVSDPRILSVRQDGTAIGLVPGRVNVIAVSGAEMSASVMVEVTRRAAETSAGSGAAWLGLLIPGAGQFATGRGGAGTLVVAAVAGSAAAGYLITQERQLCAAPPGPDGRCPAASVLESVVERPYEMVGVGVAAGISLIAAIIAISGSAETGSGTRALAQWERLADSEQRVSVSPSSDGGLAWRVRFRR